MSWWSELWGDQSKAFDQYGNDMRGIGQGYNPWINRGNQAGDLLWGQDQQEINDPNFIQNKIASGFYESPYQNNLQNLTQQRLNTNAANTGMLGSGAANSALQDQLLKQTGQFQNDFVNRGEQDYGRGMNSLGDLSQLGLKALGSQSDINSQAAAGNLKGAQSRMAWPSKMWGTIAGGVGGLASQFGGWGKKIGNGLSDFGDDMNDQAWNNSTYDMGGG
jgi:hypothetical protein